MKDGTILVYEISPGSSLTSVYYWRAGSGYFPLYQEQKYSGIPEHIYIYIFSSKCLVWIQTETLKYIFIYSVQNV